MTLKEEILKASRIGRTELGNNFTQKKEENKKFLNNTKGFSSFLDNAIENNNAEELAKKAKDKLKETPNEEIEFILNKNSDFFGPYEISRLKEFNKEENTFDY